MSIADLDPNLHRYIAKSDGSGGDADEKTKKLRDFGMKLKDEKDKQLSRLSSYKPADLASVRHQRRHLLKVMNAFHEEAEKLACSCITECCDEVMNLVVALIHFLRKSTTETVLADEFIEDMMKRLKNHSKIRQLKFYRDALRTKVRAIVKVFPGCNFHQLALRELDQSFFLYESELSYPQPSAFDDALPLFVEHLGLCSMVDSIVAAILEGSVQCALVTIASFSELIKESLSESHQAANTLIIYTAVVRYVFNEAYLRRADLNAGVKENTEFLRRADMFRKQPIHQIDIPVEIKKRYAQHMDIGGLFSKKQRETVDNLQFQTNPIDMLMTLYLAQQEIARYYGEKFKPLKFEETTTLMLALFAVNPPCNAVSLARFLNRWKELTIFPEANKARDLFISSIQKIYSFQEEEYEEEEDEKEPN